jgi:hypothetical protein
VANVARPGTILAWYRKLIARQFDGSKTRRPGRPRIKREVEHPIVHMTKENRDWLTGPGRICCQLVRFDNRWVVVLGLVDRVEISHIRIGPAGIGRISSRGSGSSPSQRT